MYLGEPRGSDGCNSYLVHLRSEHPSIYLQRGIALERPTKGAAANFRPPRPAWNALQLLLNNWRIMRGVIMRPMIMARTGIIISGELAGFGTKSTGFGSSCSWFIGTDSRLTTPTLTQRAIPLQKSTSVQYHSNTDVQYQSCTAQYQPNRTPSDNTRTTRYNNLMTRRIEKIRLELSTTDDITCFTCFTRFRQWLQLIYWHSPDSLYDMIRQHQNDTLQQPDDT